jgi:hypothetical protein
MHNYKRENGKNAQGETSRISRFRRTPRYIRFYYVPRHHSVAAKARQSRFSGVRSHTENP